MKGSIGYGGVPARQQEAANGRMFLNHRSLLDCAGLGLRIYLWMGDTNFWHSGVHRGQANGEM